MKVLFACTGNSHRSPLAEALLKKLRADIEVDSAGIQCAIPISKEVEKYLKKENAVQFLKRSPEALHNKQLGKYDLIIAMEQRHKDYVLSKCPKCENRIVVWHIKDPYFMLPKDAEKVYRQVREKVMEIAESL